MGIIMGVQLKYGYVAVYATHFLEAQTNTPQVVSKMVPGLHKPLNTCALIQDCSNRYSEYNSCL